MKIKHGFTLAEVLVALAIVGILAAVTLPTIQASLKKSAIGPAVMKIIGTLENANRLILQEKDTDSLTSLCQNEYFKCIAKKASLSKTYKKGEGPNFYQNFEGTETAKYSYIGDVYTSDDGMAFAYYQYAEPRDCASPGLPDNLKDKYEGKYYMILVDTNGVKGAPNIMGKDIFSFIVDGNGSVMAQGSREYISYNELNSNSNNYWDKTGNCPNNKVPTGRAGRLCGGSVVDNGGKVLYKY